MASALSSAAGAAAAEEACDQVLAGFEREQVRGSPEFVLAFASKDHVRGFGEIAKVIRRRLNPRALIGVTAESVIGGAIEQEGAPGLSLLAARLPGVECTPFTIEDLPLIYSTGVGLAGLPSRGEADDFGDEGDITRLAAATGIDALHRATFLFADPFTASVPMILPALAAARRLHRDEHAPPGPVLGGIASASARPKGNALLMGERVLDSGIVGLTLRGAVRVDAVVSQGCRPFGPALLVTAARGNVIKKLGGRPALQVLNDAIESLADEERELLRKGVFVGRVVNEYKDRFGRGDFLVRDLMGVSKDSGEIAIREHVRVGQTVQFHLRDARSADEDLAMLLDAQRLYSPPLGALLVTCNGRGRRMFAHPNHDAAAFARLFTPDDPGEKLARGGNPLSADGISAAPLAGMFATGEIGPVGDEVHTHGFTACAAVFRAGP
jgi:small ligand-binding sensory domain FIST